MKQLFSIYTLQVKNETPYTHVDNFAKY